eukprot:CAMPEP_0195282052 /NCGR_PEP_ID=MMETSP0707-20130614/1102_1 /TAXON_ID=33640 /ORGANISM="Asterionellopsis glacialis, Strain CCMP134" /LENGTH=358 /DNA_ID=CAMNT_0040341003 /DNA_START=80 /DNA_END=1156 /DNA_ORIENTATION=+
MAREAIDRMTNVVKVKKKSLRILSVIGALSIYFSIDHTTASIGRHLSSLRKPNEVTSAEVKSLDDSNLHCLSSDEPYNTKHFLHGQTIYMLGDSTMRGQFRELCNKWTPNRIINDIRLIEPINPDDPEEDLIRMCSNKMGTTILFRYQTWFQPGSVGLMETKFRNFLAGSSDSSKPSVIYFNGGLHLLHLYPYYGFRLLWPVYKNIERHAIQFVRNAKLLAPDAVVVYMNSHDICEDKYKAGWATAVRNLKNNPMSVANPCAEHLKRKYNVKRRFATKACLNSTFTSDGVRNLNGRIERAIASVVQKDNIGKVGCVDAFAITEGRCEDTIDGRHYQRRVPQELNSLAMVVQQYEQIEK